tara:strand:- start:65680 stop:66171 length:492 start_codon:yes stop_codon:yes gene_type:complete
MTSNRILNIVFLTVLTIGISCSSSKPALESLNRFDYEVTCEQIGKEGTQSMIISTIQKNADIALAEARRQAVHAILVKGLNSGACNVPPLVDQSKYAANQQYFNNFFDSDAYKQFVVSASDRARDLIYVGKQVKVSSNVVIARNALRDRLVSDKIISSMGNIL